MKRYEEDGQEEGFFEEEVDESQEGMSVEATIDLQGNLIEVMQLELAEQGLNQELLDIAIDLAKQDFWWYFRNPIKKIRRVEKIYRRLANVVRETLGKEE